MSEENGNGAEPTQAEIAAVFQQACAEQANLLSEFFPGATDQDLINAATRAILETEKLAPVVQDAWATSPMILTHPSWGWRLHKIVAGQRKDIGHILVPKDVKLVHSANDVTHWVACLALLTSPSARAALRLMGYDIEFVASRQLPPALVRG